MTEHPLTDEICDQIQDSVHPCDPENMRTAADWQLEQAIAWLKLNTDDYLLQDYYKTYFLKTYFLTEAFLDDFKKAMRPTTTTQDN